jgi:hypothetical protein
MLNTPRIAMPRVIGFMASSFRNKGYIHVILIGAFAMPMIGLKHVTV